MRKSLVFIARNVVLVLMLLQLTINSSGQDHRKKQADTSIEAPRRFISQLEFLAGPSIKYYSGNSLFKEAYDLEIGYLASIGFVHEFSKQVVLIMEAAYESKGTKVNYTSLHTDYSPPKVQRLVHEIHINYLTVTFLPALKLSKGQKLSLGCGPYLGYLLPNSRILQELYLEGTLILKFNGRQDPYESYDKYDAGVVMMMGYEFLAGERRSAHVQLLYSVGMVDINRPMIFQTRTNLVSFVFGLTINKYSRTLTVTP